MEIPAEINKMNAALADIVANQVDAGRVSCLFIQNLISYHRFFYHFTSNFQLKISIRSRHSWIENVTQINLIHRHFKMFPTQQALKISRESFTEIRTWKQKKKIHLLPQTIKRTRGKSPTETSARIAVSTCKVNCRYTWAVCISWSSSHLGWMNFTSGLMASADKMKQKLRRSN